MKVKKHIALSGTGTLAYCTAAAWHEASLFVEPLSIHCTSGGCFTGVPLAMGFSAEDVVMLLQGFNLSKMQDWNPFPFVNWSPSGEGCGLLKGDAIKRALEGIVGSATFKDCQIDLNITASDVAAKKCVFFNKTTTPNMRLVDAMRASISIPVLFNVPVIEGRQYVDGGIFENIPLSQLSDKDLLGIKVESPWVDNTKPLSTIVDVALASIEMLMLAAERKYIEDAKFAKLVRVKVDKSGLRFDHSKKDIHDMMIEAKKQTRDQLDSILKT